MNMNPNTSKWRERALSRFKELMSDLYMGDTHTNASVLIVCEEALAQQLAGFNEALIEKLSQLEAESYQRGKMDSVMKKVDAQIGNAVRRLGSEDTPTVKEWEKEFELSMRDGQHPFVWPNGNTNWDSVKAFISKVEAEAYKRGREAEAIDHTKKDKDAYSAGCRNVLESLKEFIQKMIEHP